MHSGARRPLTGGGRDKSGHESVFDQVLAAFVFAEAGAALLEKRVNHGFTSFCRQPRRSSGRLSIVERLIQRAKALRKALSDID